MVKKCTEWDNQANKRQSRHLGVHAKAKAKSMKREVNEKLYHSNLSVLWNAGEVP